MYSNSRPGPVSQSDAGASVTLRSQSLCHTQVPGPRHTQMGGCLGAQVEREKRKEKKKKGRKGKRSGEKKVKGRKCGGGVDDGWMGGQGDGGTGGRAVGSVRCG